MRSSPLEVDIIVLLKLLSRAEPAANILIWYNTKQSSVTAVE
jgi:hypothetical protein